MDRTEPVLARQGPRTFWNAVGFTFRKFEMARILIIEDNVMNMKHVVMLLKTAGHTTLSAGDAETGLVLARTDKPDLILMDIQLPGMNGLEATALLKADPVTAAIPIIILTATLGKSDEEKARAAGSDAYIVKPFRRDELDVTIAELLQASIESLLLKGGLPPAAAND
jgi:two-component system cell cycle response regulator DivK